ncbi:hypothetical protein CHU98_g8750 [Xylaria longipes]|nr:hypothetical protein CHU98_g8750 [Xylaria longipes]
MFGIMRFNSQHSDPQFINRTESFHGGQSIQHLACDSCRAKKTAGGRHQRGSRGEESARNSSKSSVSTSISAHTSVSFGNSPEFDTLGDPESPATTANVEEQLHPHPDLNTDSQLNKSNHLPTHDDQEMICDPHHKDQLSWSDILDDAGGSRQGQEQESAAMPNQNITDDASDAPPEFLFDQCFTDMDHFLPASVASPCHTIPLENQARATETEGQDKCQCLSVIVTLLDELDSILIPNAPYSAATDSLLAFHKTSVLSASRITSCRRCQSRSENIALLTRVCEKLARLLESIVATLLQSQPSMSMPVSPISMRHGSFSGDQLSSMASPVVLCGSYPADSSEWQYVIHALAFLQFGALRDLVAELRRHAPRQHLIRLQSTELKTQSLFQRLQHFNAGKWG